MKLPKLFWLKDLPIILCSKYFITLVFISKTMKTKQKITIYNAKKPSSHYNYTAQVLNRLSSEKKIEWREKNLNIKLRIFKKENEVWMFK